MIDINSAKTKLYEFIFGILPAYIVHSAGTFTGGTVSCTINGSTVTGNSFSALSAAIQGLTSVVMSSTYDASTKTITIRFIEKAYPVTVSTTSVTGTVTASVSPAIPVIWLDQNAPRPAGLYVGLKMSALNASQHDWQTAPDSSGFAHIGGDRSLTLNVTTYRDGAMALMIEIYHAFKRSTSQYFLRRQGFVFVEFLSTAQDITLFFDSKAEPRALLDVLLRFGESQKDRVEFISAVKVNGDFVSDLSTITLDTITIS